MRLPTRPRYGLRTMLDVAIHQREGAPVLMREIAERQGISEKYLEHVVNGLRRAGLLRSVRGPRGGYYLGKPAEAITLLEIYEATDGEVLTLVCLEGERASCSRSSACVARSAWEGLGLAMKEYLGGINLQELVERQEELDAAGAPMYYI